MTLNSQAIALAAGRKLGVDLVLANTNKPMLVDKLSEAEAARLSRFVAPSRKISYLRGRNALRLLLEMLGDVCGTSNIVFPHPRFSLTHSGDTAIAVAHNSNGLKGIGIDLEIERSPRPESARFFLASHEQEWIDALPFAERSQGLLSLWTVKEALFKADPDNRNRWLADYRVEAPGAAVGRAGVGCDRTLRFKYCRFKLKAGALAVAVLSVGDRDD